MTLVSAGTGNIGYSRGFPGERASNDRGRGGEGRGGRGGKGRKGEGKGKIGGIAPFLKSYTPLPQPVRPYVRVCARVCACASMVNI